MQGRAEQQVALLAGAIKAAIQDEQAARQKRHSFTLEAVSDMGMLLPETLHPIVSYDAPLTSTTTPQERRL